MKNRDMSKKKYKKVMQLKYEKELEISSAHRQIICGDAPDEIL